MTTGHSWMLEFQAGSLMQQARTKHLPKMMQNHDAHQ